MAEGRKGQGEAGRKEGSEVPFCWDLRNYARALMPCGFSALVGTTATRIKDVLFSEQSAVAVLGRTRSADAA